MSTQFSLNPYNKIILTDRNGVEWVEWSLVEWVVGFQIISNSAGQPSQQIFDFSNKNRLSSQALFLLLNK